MSALSVFEIYNDFRTNYQADPDFTIDFRTKNSIFFNNYKSFKDADELCLFMELTAMYIQALYTKDRYNAVIDEAGKDLKVIDEAIGNLNPYQIKNQFKWYYEIIFVKAMAFYRLQDYKTCEKLFKELVSIDPQNDAFAIWLNHAKYRNRTFQIKIMYIICLVAIFSEAIFKSYNIGSYSIRIALLIVGIIGILSITGYEMWIKRSFRKIDKV
jgi:hypothetical protein